MCVGSSIIQWFCFHPYLSLGCRGSAVARRAFSPTDTQGCPFGTSYFFVFFHSERPEGFGGRKRLTDSSWHLTDGDRWSTDADWPVADGSYSSDRTGPGSFPPFFGIKDSPADTPHDQATQRRRLRPQFNACCLLQTQITAREAQVQERELQVADQEAKLQKMFAEVMGQQGIAGDMKQVSCMTYCATPM